MRNRHRDETVLARQVRSLFDDGSTVGLSDGALLERFASRKGESAESAFASLVERHGPMVLRVCRSILGDPHEAQDAFQSTFLLLANRAGSLWVRDSLGPWLHSVACRVSCGARAAVGRRRALERRAAGRLARSVDDPRRDDLDSALHEEIERLPDRLKAPLVLCYLEDLTHEQAADHLACPVGTVRSRLARGRDRLRRGLARRGFAPPISSDMAPPAIPAALAGLTIRAARLASDRSSVGLVTWWSTILSEGVIPLMLIHPWKFVTALVVSAGAIAAVVGVTSGQEPRPPEKPASSSTTPTAAEALARDRLADDRRFAAIEQRLRDLEKKLAEVEAAGRRPPARINTYDPDTVHKIRSRFDNALVEKVYVQTGQLVKKGEPLLDIKCADLAAAKNDVRTRFVQWDHDHKYLVAREPLAKEGRIAQSVWVDTQNDEKKSRLDYLVARERLKSFGISNEDIDKLLEDLGDDENQARKARNQVHDLSKMTILSPIDGIVVQRDVVPGNFYDMPDVLLLIAPNKP